MPIVDLVSLDNYMTTFGKNKIPENAYYKFYKISLNGFVRTEKWLGKLLKEDEDFYLLVFSYNLEITEKIINTDTKIARVILKYYNGDKLEEKDFSGEIFSKVKVNSLCDYGIRYWEKQINFLNEYLAVSDSIAPVRYVYSKLGFNKDDKICFKGCKAFGTTDRMFYSGGIDIKPKGSIDVWKAMVDKQVLYNVPLTFVLCCGFASPVLQYLNYNNDLGSVMFNLANKSSTGKTTAEMLAVSAFSNPLMSSGTLISFNGTEQSISDFISNCRGFTIAIDEYGMCAIKNPFQFFYTVCSGKSKKRLNSLGEQREVKDYSSVIISSAEHKLTEGAQEGVLVRIFELNDNLTSSAEQSDEIKRTVIENYAVAAEPFIMFLLTKLETLQTDYMNEIQKLLEMSDGSNPLKKRIFSKLAIITLSADYVKSALNLSLDVDKLREYAVKIEKEISTGELPEQHLLELIQEDVSTHYSKYAFDKSNISDKGYGLVLRENGYVEYYITKPVFKRIIDENNISNYNTILDKLKKDGILICEDDRKTIRKRIISGMNSQVCYGFRLKDDIQETETNNSDNNCENPYRRTISSKRNCEKVISEDEVCDIDDIDLELTSKS